MTGMALCCAQVAKDVHAGHLGQHEVEHDEVGRTGLHCGERGLAVARGLDGEAFALQVERQHLLYREFVVHDEDALWRSWMISR